MPIIVVETLEEQRNKRIADAVAAVEEEIKARHISDGHSGSRTSSARTLEIQLEFYELGLNREIPQSWEKITMKTDPEYKEYQRLKKKFGGLVE